MKGAIHSLATAVVILGGLAGWATCVTLAHAQAALPVSAKNRLTVGPTYTSGDGKTEPQYPSVDVVFNLSQPNGTPVVARAEDLKLFSTGKEVASATSIRSFEQAGYGITSILALDASGSMRGAPINAIHNSIAKFVNQARKQDLVEVLTFADQTQVEVPFGADRSALTNELETVQPRGTSTHLYDGLLDAMVQFNRVQPKRRQLVVISDGHDEGSKHIAGDVIFRARSLGVVIDSIGLTNDSGQYLAGLQQIAQQTGGTFGRAYTATDLDTLIDQGIRATRITPVAAFNTVHLDADAKLHAVQLHWLPAALSAPAFIQTPQGHFFGNLYILGLGGCFLAGLILLMLSMLGSRRKPALLAPHIAVGGGGAFQTPMLVQRPMPVPPLSPMAPSIVRAPTQPDFDVVLPPLPSDKVTLVERSRTQLAGFFHAAAEGPYALLKFESGALAGESVPMRKTSLTIGAVEGNDLLLADDETISSSHAHLLWESAILKIEDLQSTNGTFVNAIRLTSGRHLLKPGDEVRVGQTTMTVEVVAART